jgi:branched-chain amino acid transport system ATP-binding protein
MLEIESLGVNYGPVVGVKEITMSIKKGELITLLGANGAGKSSTLLAIVGAIKSARGKIVFSGQDITSKAPEKIIRMGIAMVPETRDVFPDLTTRENLMLGAFIHSRDSAGIARDMERMFSLFPILKNRLEQAAGSLSGGEQQQLVIARSLMSRPKLLLLDEPSLGLAPAIVDQIFELIHQLKEEGLTILLVEQNAVKALELADRAYVMSLGKIAAEGEAKEIASNTDLASIYFGN